MLVILTITISDWNLMNNQMVEETLKELVTAYNAKNGAALGVRGRSTLLLPTATIQRFFLPVITKIGNHVKELLDSLVSGSQPGLLQLSLVQLVGWALGEK